MVSDDLNWECVEFHSWVVIWQMETNRTLLGGPAGIKP